MTENFKKWWSIFGESSLLFLYVLIYSLVRFLLWLLWIPTLGYSIRWPPERYKPRIKGRSFVSFGEPLIAFYRRRRDLDISMGGYDRDETWIKSPEFWPWIEEEGRIIRRITPIRF